MKLNQCVAMGLLGVMGLAMGCGATADKPKPLSPNAFVSPATSTDQGASKVPGDTVSPTMKVNTPQPKPDEKPLANVTPRPPEISPLVASEIKPLVGNAPNTAATMPAIGASSGQFLTLGGVVAEVNGTPIYANKIITLLESTGLMQEKARQNNAERFKAQMTNDIQRTIQELILGELEYAAALRNLDDQDRRMADSATIYWRMQKITQAGGSVELARRKALKDSYIDFDELTREQSRLELSRLYYQKKVYPRIQVSAADVRDYYDKNRDTKFSAAEKITFRILMVDVKATGGIQKARDKMADKYKRAINGEDFKEMVLKENDDKRLAKEDMGEMGPASFFLPKVAQAMTKLQPNGLTEIIEEKDGLYVAQLLKRTGGTVRPFDELKVQEEIRTTLRTEQFRNLRDQERMKLIKGAIVSQNEQMFRIALEMAMQKYPMYAAK